MPHEEQEQERATTRGGLPRRTLAEWREVRGITQMKLASAVGVMLATIANVEQQRHEPSLNTAAKIAAALDLDIDQIIWPMGEAVRQYPSKTAAGRAGAKNRRLNEPDGE